VIRRALRDRFPQRRQLIVHLGICNRLLRLQRHLLPDQRAIDQPIYQLVLRHGLGHRERLERRESLLCIHVALQDQFPVHNRDHAIQRHLRARLIARTRLRGLPRMRCRARQQRHCQQQCCPTHRSVSPGAHAQKACPILKKKLKWPA
jgi:putative component of toxin-antitoxin plasmid stabilization module